MEAADWDKINDHVLRRIPAVIPVAGKRGISFVVGHGGATLGLRIPYDGPSQICSSPYAELGIELVTVNGKPNVEVSTGSAELFNIFYLFACAAAEFVEDGGLDAPAAIQGALGKFGQLLVRRSLMPEERQLGLFGELCVLEALLKAQGVPIFDAWLGPRKERHDFRLGKNEIEVKSTRRVQRIHVIHGLGQLEPSPGRRLFIVSLQFERAGHGAGRTLPERVASVREFLAAGIFQRSTYDDYLARLGYRDADAMFYPEKFQFKSRPVLVEVDGACPKLVSAELAAVLSNDLLARIDEVQYEVNLDGLGFEDGSADYQKLLPGIPALE